MPRTLFGEQRVYWRTDNGWGGVTAFNIDCRLPSEASFIRFANRMEHVQPSAIRDLLRWYTGTLGGKVYHNVVPIGDIGEITEDGGLGYRVVGSYEATKDP